MTDNEQHRTAIDLVTTGKVLELIDRDDLNPRIVFGALCFGLWYSHHDDRKAKGYITTEQARAVLNAYGADEPDDHAANLLAFMEPSPCKQERGATHWPINRGPEQAAADQAWGMVQGIERGWFAYARAGFLHWSVAGRDRYAVGTADTFVEASGQSAFAF